jgi:dihydropyrimidine dehydrogenase (NAD+) subunit PreT
VVGAGPAGLAAAHRLAVKGHDVVIYDAKPKSGGLNEYGIATYKAVDDFAQKEVDYVLSIGGIEVEHGQLLGRDIELADLQAQNDAVFLGIGLAGVNALRVEGENLRASTTPSTSSRHCARPTARPILPSAAASSFSAAA